MNFKVLAIFVCLYITRPPQSTFKKRGYILDVHTPATVRVGFAGDVEQAVNEVEHRAVLRIEHVDDIIVSLIKLLIWQKSCKSIQIQQMRALDLRDFEQICGIYFPSLRE